MPSVTISTPKATMPPSRTKRPESPVLIETKSLALTSGFLFVLLARALSQPSLRGAKRRSNPQRRKADKWIASLRSQ
jgi:hypothetical protein